MKLHPWRTHLLALAGSCLALTTGHALADCGPGQTTVFSCLTAKGKRIQVCDAGATIDYSFGKPDAPAEIVVRAPRAQAATSQWGGVGRYISYSVQVPNGNTTYTVFTSVDKMADQPKTEAGVHVEVKRKLVATVQCAPEQPLVERLQGIALPALD